MSRSLKKGPFVETRLLSRITAMNEAGNLVPRVHHLPRDGWSHHRRP